MKKEDTKYVAPSAKTVEINAQAIICQSDPAKWTTDSDPVEDRF